MASRCRPLFPRAASPELTGRETMMGLPVSTAYEQHRSIQGRDREALGRLAAAPASHADAKVSLEGCDGITDRANALEAPPADAVYETVGTGSTDSHVSLESRYRAANHAWITLPPGIELPATGKQRPERRSFLRFPGRLHPRGRQLPGHAQLVSPAWTRIRNRALGLMETNHGRAACISSVPARHCPASAST
jgi:hypothetical protein